MSVDDSPAVDGVVGCERTSIDRADGDRTVRSGRNVEQPEHELVSPADDAAIDRYATTVAPADRDGLEGPGRRVRLGPRIYDHAVCCGSPTGDGVVDCDRTGAVLPDRDGLVSTSKILNRFTAVGLPADDAAIDRYGTTVAPADRDRPIGTSRRFSPP